VRAASNSRTPKLKCLPFFSLLCHPHGKDAATERRVPALLLGRAALDQSTTGLELASMTKGVATAKAEALEPWIQGEAGPVSPS
jgi:hypothetical protein